MLPSMLLGVFQRLRRAAGPHGMGGCVANSAHDRGGPVLSAGADGVDCRAEVPDLQGCAQQCVCQDTGQVAELGGGAAGGDRAVGSGCLGDTEGEGPGLVEYAVGAGQFAERVAREPADNS